MLAPITANGVNVLANLALIHGRWGFPRLGVVGAAWATCSARPTHAFSTKPVSPTTKNITSGFGSVDLIATEQKQPKRALPLYFPHLKRLTDVTKRQLQAATRL